MTREDYIDFVATLEIYMPSTASWLKDQAVSQKASNPGRETIHTAWAELLGDATPIECREVIKRIASKDIPPPASWQDLPGVIRKEVGYRRPKPIQDWQKPAYRPSEDSEFLKFSKRMHEVAARYDNGLGSITLDQAKAEHKAILAEYDAHVAAKRYPSKEFANT
jgi:hypothetical protein